MSNSNVKTNNVILLSALLQYVPQSFPDIMTIFNAIQLRYTVVMSYISKMNVKNNILTI